LNALFGHEGATWRQNIRTLAGKLADLFFPPVCASCKSVGELLCVECRQKISWVLEPVCPRCGRSQSKVVDECKGCSQNPIPLQQVRTAVYYEGPVAEVVKQFKYEGYFGLASPLAELMLAAWPRWKQPVDLVVPIPLHTARYRERGYNQSELLARVLEGHLDWRIEPGALKRVRRTRPQVGLNMAERRSNVSGAFIADAALVQGKKILLIDDVRTTGATLVSAAEVLLDAGAKSVSAYCLAGAGSDFNSEKALTV
jgi:ComF family protein